MLSRSGNPEVLPPWLVNGTLVAIYEARPPSPKGHHAGRKKRIEAPAFPPRRKCSRYAGGRICCPSEAGPTPGTRTRALAEPKKKTGGYRLGSALIWAVALGGISWLADGFWASLGSALGGFVAGWSTASLLGWFGRFHLSKRAMAMAGLILGVLLSSGAVTGLRLAFAILRPDAVEIDWAALVKFLLSWSALPAAVLGAATGLRVRAKFPSMEREE